MQRAIDEDQKQNYPEAYKQYQNALDYFMLGLKCMCTLTVPLFDGGRLTKAPVVRGVAMTR